MNRTPLAVSHRSGRVDALHYGSVAVVDLNGTVIHAVNDPHFPTYLRSSSKMFQALPVVLSCAADRFSFDASELAVCCASHVGADYHLATVSRMLGKIGLGEAHLGCGAHEPDDRAERKRLICSDTAPTQLHNNCSGKHAGMLAACLASDWPVETYLAIEHPLQQWILDLMAEYSGIRREHIGIGIDGCSLPALYMPISGIATALARFVGKAKDIDGAERRIMAAVNQHPEMINDVGAFDTELVRALQGRAIAKRGAMAIFVVGLDTERYGPIGVAVKLEDGNMAPMPIVVMKVLQEIGVLSDAELDRLASFRTMRLSNWRGMDIGEVATNFQLH